MAVIRVEHLRKEYPEVTPLEDVSFEVEKGEIISIIGPSGTGKSTLLRCLNALEQPTSGRIFINDEEITGKDCKIEMVRRRMGMVFQSFNLFEHRTVVENVMMAPMKLLGTPKQEAYDEAISLLNMVGLEKIAFKYPKYLSGGQKQRVAIARTLAMHPDIILFDEPTSALDPTMVHEVAAVICDLAQQGYTMLMVTHEMKLAERISTRVLYMDEGGIYESGTAEQIFHDPIKPKTQAFILEKKAFTYHIADRKFDLPKLSGLLMNYARDLGLSSRRRNSLLLIFEELLTGGLIQHYGDQSPNIDIIAQPVEDDQYISVRFDYDGDNYDPVAELDTIATDLVKGISRKLEHSYDGMNHLIVEL